MKKNKVFAGVTAVALMLSVSSLAYFTDRAEGQFQAKSGNVCLSMSDIDGDLSELAPGDVRDVRFEYENLGTLAIDTRVTYTASYELDGKVEEESENDLDKVATLSTRDEVFELTAEAPKVKKTIETGTLSGSEELVGDAKLSEVLKFKFDESVGNIGQKMSFNIDIIVEGKQNRNNPTWEELHTISIKINGFNVDVVEQSACNAKVEKANEKDFKYIKNGDGTIKILGLNDTRTPEHEFFMSFKKMLQEDADELGWEYRTLLINEREDILRNLEDHPQDFEFKLALEMIQLLIAEDNGEIIYDESYTNSDDINRKEIIIPSHIDGAEVTAIGDRAFMELGVSRVVIPDTVKEIGVMAFGNTPYFEKEEADFEWNEIESLAIPDSVETIKGLAFANMGIKELSLGSRVKTIGELAFAKNEFTEISIADSVEKIGYSAFLETPLSKVYANELENDSWPTLRGYDFEETTSLLPLK